MAASGKFETSSGSPDRSIYTPRGSYTGPPMDRSGSFRERKEPPMLSSLPSMSRSSTSVTKGEVANFMHCLPFDSKSIAADYKLNRQVASKQLANVLQVDDSPPSIPKGKPMPSPSPEDLKRLKASLRESTIKARERVKIFNEATSVVNKCFPAIPSRKRSRLDVLSSERASTLVSGERSVVGSSLSKAGTQAQAIASGFEPEPQVPEEKVKIGIPNKRTRTSMVDVRTDMRTATHARSSGCMEREVLRVPSSGAVHGEERSLTVGVDSWQKSKMKKKRSGIKPDSSSSSVATKPNDGIREAKQGMQQRHPADARPKLNESHGFRQGISSGAVGAGKADVTNQPSGAGIRSSIPQAEQDNNSQLQDKRDRPPNVDKERGTLRVVNKTNSKEDFSSPSPTSNIKMNSAARAPRSGPNILHKLSSIVQRTPIGNDWELPHSTSKNPAAGGANNGKRKASTGPSSPPVTQWASHRPPKISRTARRTNFVPLVSINDEIPAAVDATCDISGNETGSGFARRLSTGSPLQCKSKSDHISSPMISDSEESGATDTKVRDKTMRTNGVDEKASPNFQKVSALPPRKNKLVNDDEIGTGVRRQGRTGRGFTSTRSLMPVDKLGNVGTAKQLRSAKLGFEKTESKVGRPPSRKLSDRKPYARQKQITINTAAEFHDDGHEELLAAAAAVTDPAHCFSSPFWRQMEQYFSFFSDSDLAYLNQQGNPAPTTSAALPFLNSCSNIPNGFGLNEAGRDSNHMESPELLSPNMVPLSSEASLYQRFMSAIITDDECEELSEGHDGLQFDDDETVLELDKLEMEESLGNLQFAGAADINGSNNLDCILLDTNMTSEKGSISDFGFLQNGTDRTLEPEFNNRDFQYRSMSLDDRLLLELESIGLPNPSLNISQTGEDEVSKEISRLKENHLAQVLTRKEALFSKLHNSASETRRIEEKEFEKRALDKLLVMSYQKYMASQGPNPSGGKNASRKMAKQAALTFVKRTLDQYRQFEVTGKSCFSDAFFRDIFISGSARLRDDPLFDGKSDSDSGKHLAGGSSDVRAAAMGTQQSHYGQYINQEESWSNRVNNKKSSSDEVVGATPLGIGCSLSSSAKGRRSERDREGFKNGTPKIARSTSGNIKNDKKNKTKPKQKSSQLSASVNCLVNKLPEEQPKATMPLHPGSSAMKMSDNVKEDDEMLEDPIDLSHLQLPGMDDFGGPDDLDVQGQDIGSWLNMDEDLPDQDGFDGLNGLEIPMDDLSELNMKF